MGVIKKIFDREFDSFVHSDFLKFGRGEYKDKYLLEGKKQSNKWAIKTGPDFANILVNRFLKKFDGSVEVKGVVISTVDIRDEIPFDIVKVSNFQGIRKIQIGTSVDSGDVIELMNKYPRFFYALSFKGNNFDLKIKAKAPKSAKPGKSSEDGPKADFCTLKTNDKSFVEELFFDCIGFNEVKVNHTILISDIIYPKDITDMKPAEVRENSKRKGKVIRKVNCDGKEETREAEFVA